MDDPGNKAVECCGIIFRTVLVALWDSFLNERKPSNDGLTKRVCFISATCLYSLLGLRTTLLSMYLCPKERD